MHSKKIFVIFLAGLFLIQCAGGTTKSTSGYRETIGDYRRGDISFQTRKLLEKYGFEFERFEAGSAGDIYIETRWKTRTPYDEEAANGVISARTKIIIRGRDTGRSLNFTSNETMYKAVFETENDVMLTGQREWSKQSYCEELTKYLKKLYEELESELRFTR
ncbi:hypothetical protein ACFL6G_05785 [candidate division KSB1 bacterium]